MSMIVSGSKNFPGASYRGIDLFPIRGKILGTPGFTVRLNEQSQQNFP